MKIFVAFEYPRQVFLCRPNSHVVDDNVAFIIRVFGSVRNKALGFFHELRILRVEEAFFFGLVPTLRFVVLVTEVLHELRG